MFKINNQVRQNLASPLSSILVLFAVGSIYISQLIFQEIANGFGVDVLEARYAFIFASSIYAFSFFFFGPLSDKIKSRKLSLFGGIGGSICLLLSTQTNDFTIFLVFLSMLGFFAASIPAAIFSYTAKTASKEKLTSAMGLMISASVIGIISARSAVGLLTDLIGWRESFILYSLSLLVLSLIFQIIPDEKETNKNTNIFKLYKNALGMFFDKNILMRFIVGFCLFFAYLGISSFMTYELKSEPFYLTSSELSWLNLVGISAIIGSRVAAYVSKYISANSLILILLIGAIFSIFIIGFSYNIVLVALGIFLMFIMVFAVQPVIMSNLSLFVNTEQKGTISSLYFLSCLIGGSASTYILGWVWNNFSWQGVVFSCIASLSVSVLITFTFYKSYKFREIQA